MNGEGAGVWLTVAGVALREPLLLSVALSLILGVGGVWIGAHLSEHPGKVQVLAEYAVTLMSDAVAEVVPAPLVTRVMPLIATFWVFIVFSNLMGLIPGLSSPTSDLSVTSALAIIVFLAVHGFGFAVAGWRNYLRHYLTPSPVMLPFHLVSELTRTLALAIRLFGNMMSLEMAALLVLVVAGFLVPVPLLLLHVVEALVQAYIFGMLALIYIGGALDAAHLTDLPSSTENES
jgi:F-type H+-transporting ATPase subunit a